MTHSGNHISGSPLRGLGFLLCLASVLLCTLTLLPTAFAAGSYGQNAQTQSTTWNRLAGQTALDTMDRIIETGWTSSTDTVVLATNSGYWDALTASGVAGLTDAAVLLTDGSSLSAQTRSELARLKPTTIVVCGGTQAITDTVVDDAARAATTSPSTVRCGGLTATGTACQLYEKAGTKLGKTWSTTAIIATNSGYWDALSIAPYAYSRGCPIFLSEGKDRLSDETLATMVDGGIKDVYIVGGTAAVSDDVVAQLKARDIAVNERLAGTTAIDTSEKIAEFEKGAGMTAENMAAATSDGYWDALTGAALCGKNGSILVLVSPSNRTTIDGFIAANRQSVTSAYLFGGYAAIPWYLEQHITTGSYCDSSIIGRYASDYCISKIGCRYDQDARWAQGVYDCSSLAYRCYSETLAQTHDFDIDSATGCSGYDLATDICYSAANEAWWIETNGKSVSLSELQPGDWIFYGGSDNGRYRGIYHVAVYIGGGEMVEAYDDTTGVIRSAFRTSDIDLYGRPYR